MKIGQYLILVLFFFSCKGKVEQEIIVAKPMDISENEITNYVEYCNNRFDICMNYPSNFKPEPEPTNGDGRVFSNEPDDAEIRIFGSTFSPNSQIKDILEILKEELEIYNLKKDKNRVEVFGLNKTNNHLHHEIIIIKKQAKSKNDELCSLSFTYPHAKRKKFKSYWRIISNSFN
ncbi:hypothetical protein EDM00_07605 [Ornithobacterium rhinotracheale]|uniref:hypothetical protein n=1 Tax=Ornithobacterium rhinotracheale TaxID=28251 RepID=UPI00129C48BF|nr:hypothetical protein [Ornithobacterium rhinotracheale]MRI63853.1 hypothetical protein [Ornithobacterium rhinotracheale]MRJ09195.1 hypothetical protein [Ornithobacterium rhinotracheale]MRJ11183.1 hypothetical protein [Ornithobacterium rhinotracheale]UOH77000.1 hypothetical protein MT996_07150 [Ornithobacterium rhinotracheale]